MLDLQYIEAADETYIKVMTDPRYLIGRWGLATLTVVQWNRLLVGKPEVAGLELR